MVPYYEDEWVTLYHGDALEVLPCLGSGSMFGVVTDPPYIIGAASAGNMASKTGGWADMMNSSLWFSAWYREVSRLLRRAGVFVSFLNWRTLPVAMKAAMDAGLPITSMGVWDKESLGPGGPQGFRPSYEMFMLSARPEFAVQDRGVSDVFRVKCGVYKPHGHPAEKPVALFGRLFDVLALPNDAVVLDPFMGSGTTLVSARERGLRCVGVEAEERWCEVAARRLSQGVLF